MFMPMCTRRISKKVISEYLVLRDYSGLFYIGQLTIDPDGIVEPCSKVSDLVDTIEEANDMLAKFKGDR